MIPYIKKLTIVLLLTVTSATSITATSLVRRAVMHAVSNRVTKTMVKPVTWPINKITQTQFYKKHPWRVKLIGAYFISVAAVATYVVLDEKYKNYRKKQRADLLKKLRNASPAELTKLIKTKKIAPAILEDTLFDFVTFGEDAHVEVLIDAKVNLNISRHGKSLLHAAVEAERVTSLERDEPQLARNYARVFLPRFTNIVRHLIQANAPLNAQNNDNETPLMVATKNGRLEMVKELIKAKADLNLKDKAQRTALHWAVKNDQQKIVAELIEAQASLNEKDVDGNTPVMLAAQHRFLVSVRRLIAAGANLNIKNNIGNNALLQAVDPNLVRLFSWDEAEVTARIVRELIDANIRINTKNNNGDTALMHAVDAKNIEAVKNLIAADAKVNKKNQYGRTALMCATKLTTSSPADQVPLKLTLMLIEAGADVHTKDNRNDTAMENACGQLNLSCIAALLLAGAEIDNATKTIDIQVCIDSTLNYMRSIRRQIPIVHDQPHMSIIADFLLGEKAPITPFAINGVTYSWSPPNNDWSTVTPRMPQQPEFNFWKPTQVQSVEKESIESKRKHAASQT